MGAVLLSSEPRTSMGGREDLQDKSPLVRFPGFFPPEKARALVGALAVAHKTLRQEGPCFVGAVLLSSEPRTSMGGREGLQDKSPLVRFPGFFLRKSSRFGGWIGQWFPTTSRNFCEQQ